MNDQNEPLLQFFVGDDRSSQLAQAFRDLAEDMVVILPRNPERTVALRKLLEALDCTLRAAIYHA